MGAKNTLQKAQANQGKQKAFCHQYQKKEPTIVGSFLAPMRC